MWLIDCDNLFHFHFERKNYKLLSFTIVYLPNFEISASR